MLRSAIRPPARRTGRSIRARAGPPPMGFPRAPLSVRPGLVRPRAPGIDQPGITSDVFSTAARHRPQGPPSRTPPPDRSCVMRKAEPSIRTFAVTMRSISWGCDHPSETQAYRLAMCGGGDPERCARTFPYVLAQGAKSRSRSWNVIDIDPKTGRLAARGQAGALHVWSFGTAPCTRTPATINPETSTPMALVNSGGNAGMEGLLGTGDFNRACG